MADNKRKKIGFGVVNDDKAAFRRDRQVSQSQGFDEMDPIYAPTPETEAGKQMFRDKVDASADQGIKDTRKKQIQDLLANYQKGLAQQDQNRKYTAQRAKTLSITNPAAAKIFMESRKGSDDQPASKFSQKQQLTKNQYGNDSREQGVVQGDQQLDSNSQVSRMARTEFQRLTGRPAPQNATASDIKRVLPETNTGIKRDTAFRNQDYVAQTADENRASREKQGSKNRGVKISQGDANRKAGIGKVIIGGALTQAAAASKGSSGGQMKTADAATIPDSLNGKGFYITKPGMPPNEIRAKEVAQLGGESRKYVVALDQAIRLVNEAGGRPNILQKNWPSVKSALARAVQANIKAIGNGVANGPDILQAEKEIGDYTSLQTWLRKGLLQSMTQARSSVPRAYDAFADSQGYMKSQKPSDTTSKMGTGGSQSSRRPVNPATAGAANGIAGAYGFPQIVAQPPQQTIAPMPQAPRPQIQNTAGGKPIIVTLKSGQKVQAIQMPDGKIVRQ